MNIEEEIDTLIDKIAFQLKTRVKKLVTRYEKQVLREYIASMKSENSAPAKGKGKSSTSTKATASSGAKSARGSSKQEKVPVKRGGRPKKESNYTTDSESSASDSDE